MRVDRIVFLLAFTRVIENQAAAHLSGGAFACGKSNSRCIRPKRNEFPKIHAFSSTSESSETKLRIAVGTKKDYSSIGLTTRSIAKANSINEFGDEFCMDPDICKAKSKTEATRQSVPLESNNQIVKRISDFSTARYASTISRNLRNALNRTTKSKEKLINSYSKGQPIRKTPNFKSDVKLNSKEKPAEYHDKKSNERVKSKSGTLKPLINPMNSASASLVKVSEKKSYVSKNYKKKIPPRKMKDREAEYEKKIFATPKISKKPENKNRNKKRGSRESKYFGCEKKICGKKKRANWHYVRKDFGPYLPMGCPVIKITNLCGSDNCDSGETSPIEQQSSISKETPPAQSDADPQSEDSPEVLSEDFRNDGSNFHLEGTSGFVPIGPLHLEPLTPVDVAEESPSRVPQEETDSPSESLGTKDFDKFFENPEDSEENFEPPFADIDEHRPKGSENTFWSDGVEGISRPEGSPRNPTESSVATKTPEYPTQHSVGSIVQTDNNVNQENRKENGGKEEKQVETPTRVLPAAEDQLKLNFQSESTATVVETNKSVSNIQEDNNTNDERNVDDEDEEDDEDDEDDDYDTEDDDENGDKKAENVDNVDEENYLDDD